MKRKEIKFDNKFYKKKTVINIDPDGWVWIKTKESIYGLGDIDVDVTIKDKR